MCEMRNSVFEITHRSCCKLLVFSLLVWVCLNRKIWTTSNFDIFIQNRN